MFGPVIFVTVHCFFQKLYRFLQISMSKCNYVTVYDDIILVEIRFLNL